MFKFAGTLSLRGVGMHSNASGWVTPIRGCGRPCRLAYSLFLNSARLLLCGMKDDRLWLDKLLARSKIAAPSTIVPSAANSGAQPAHSQWSGQILLRWGEIAG